MSRCSLITPAAALSGEGGREGGLLRPPPSRPRWQRARLFTGPTVDLDWEKKKKK